MENFVIRNYNKTQPSEGSSRAQKSDLIDKPTSKHAYTCPIRRNCWRRRFPGSKKKTTVRYCPTVRDEYVENSKIILFAVGVLLRRRADHRNDKLVRASADIPPRYAIRLLFPTRFPSFPQCIPTKTCVFRLYARILTPYMGLMFIHRR